MGEVGLTVCKVGRWDQPAIFRRKDRARGGRGVSSRARAARKARADAGQRYSAVLGIFIEGDQHFAGGGEEGPDAEVGGGFSVHDLCLGMAFSPMGWP